jgi:hypothetical protein
MKKAARGQNPVFSVPAKLSGALKLTNLLMRTGVTLDEKMDIDLLVRNVSCTTISMLDSL